MKWSKNTPTEPGYYWWREDAKGKADIVQLSRRTHGKTLHVEVIGSERVNELLPVSLWAMGQWLGPIAPEEK